MTMTLSSPPTPIARLCLSLLLITSLYSSHVTATPYRFPDFFGIGIGKTPEYHGAKESMTGAVPGGRYAFESGRYMEWYGPYAGIKVNTDLHFEYGPAVLYKLGRDEVKNSAVDQLNAIESGTELGLFVGYSVVNTNYALPFRYRAGALASHSFSGDTDGANINLYNSVWVPVNQETFVGVGAGLTWANGEFMRHNFSVSDQESQLTGIAPFAASGGLRQYYAWTGVVHRLNRHWALGAGAYLQQLTNDAKHSTITAQQGDDVQVTYGIGLGYFF